MRKAIFVFDTENSIIISKIDAPNVYDIIATHLGVTIYSVSSKREGGDFAKEDPIMTPTG